MRKTPDVVTKLSQNFSIFVKFLIDNKYFPSDVIYSSGFSRSTDIKLKFSSYFDLKIKGKVLNPESK